MQSLLQAKYRQTSIFKCFRYNLYFTGSLIEQLRSVSLNIVKKVGINMIYSKSEAVKISKLGGGKSHSRYQHLKCQYPPPPPGSRPIFWCTLHLYVLVMVYIIIEFCGFRALEHVMYTEYWLVYNIFQKYN